MRERPATCASNCLAKMHDLREMVTPTGMPQPRKIKRLHLLTAHNPLIENKGELFRSANPFGAAIGTGIRLVPACLQSVARAQIVAQLPAPEGA